MRESAASDLRWDGSDRRLFIGVMFLVLAIRACIFCTGIVSLRYAPTEDCPRFNQDHPWFAFDARHYREIAMHGYPLTRQGTPYVDGNTFRLIAYFPVVPAVGCAMSVVMPVDAGLLLFSNLCSIVAFGFLFAWARRLTDSRRAAICVLITATFPGAVSFAAGMTEGPFFLLVAVALWLLERHQFLAAAAIAGIATATRPTGLALAVAVVLYAWWSQKNVPWSKRISACILLGAVAFSGIILYEGFIWHRFHSPTAYFDAQRFWSEQDQRRDQVLASRHISRYSWEYIRPRLTSPQLWNRVIAVAVVLISLAGILRQKLVPRVTFLIPLIIFALTSLPGKGLRISSVPRYESAAIPVFLLLAIWFSSRRSKPGLIALLVLQFAAQMYYAALFPQEIWVG